MGKGCGRGKRRKGTRLDPGVPRFLVEMYSRYERADYLKLTNGEKEIYTLSGAVARVWSHVVRDELVPTALPKRTREQVLGSLQAASNVLPQMESWLTGGAIPDEIDDILNTLENAFQGVDEYLVFSECDRSRPHSVSHSWAWELAKGGLKWVSIFRERVAAARSKGTADE
jgi:hypothetical protein